MSNYIYHVGQFLYEICSSSSSSSLVSVWFPFEWQSVWSLDKTPIYLIFLLMPIVNLKSLSFFTKFNAFGILSIIYIIFFVGFNVSQRGIHCNDSVLQYSSNFPALTGILSMSFFIHTGILSITRNSARPERNVRDLVIAYICVGITYLFVGAGIYLSFPGDKSCFLC
eukprot:Sdes_comp10179_c0_seq2m1793